MRGSDNPNTFTPSEECCYYCILRKVFKGAIYNIVKERSGRERYIWKRGRRILF
jgi:hypothetical protein